VEQNQRKEESILEKEENENSNTEKGTEQDGTEVIIATKEELNIFTKLVKNINYFHARRRKYCEPNFTAWLTKQNNPQLGDGFAFDTLGHFFYNFIAINKLKHPGNVRYWEMDSKDWNDYLNRIGTDEASQDESSDEERVRETSNLQIATSSQTGPGQENAFNTNEGSATTSAQAKIQVTLPQQKGPANIPVKAQEHRPAYSQIISQVQREETRNAPKMTKNKWVRDASPSPEPLRHHVQIAPRLYDPDGSNYYEPTKENVSLQLLIDSHNEQVRVSEMDKEIIIDNLNDETKGVRQWFRKYEFLTEVAGWNEARKSRKLPGFLREEALGIWKRLDPTKLGNYEYAKSEILRKIDNVERRAAAKMEYLNGTQSVAESAKDFARRLKRLYNAAGGELNDTKGEEMSEAFLITILERGLQPELAKLTLTRNLKNWDEAMEYMKKLDLIPSQSNQLGIFSITGESKGKFETGTVNKLDSMSVPFCTFCKRLHHTKPECRKWMATQTVGQSDFPLGSSQGQKTLENNRNNSQDVRKSDYNNQGYNRSARQRPNQSADSENKNHSANNKQV
jgi:hypothetical protein